MIYAYLLRDEINRASESEARDTYCIYYSELWGLYCFVMKLGGIASMQQARTVMIVEKFIVVQ